MIHCIHETSMVQGFGHLPLMQESRVQIPEWTFYLFWPFFQTFRAYICFQLRVAKLGPWYIENICIEEALISIPSSSCVRLTLKIKYGKLQFQGKKLANFWFFHMFIALKKTFNIAKVSKPTSAATLRPITQKKVFIFCGGPDQCALLAAKWHNFDNFRSKMCVNDF